MIIGIGLAVAVAVLAFFVVRHLLSQRAITARPQGYSPPRSAAVDELDLRYARGEIGRDEYLGRRADLFATTGVAWAGGPHDFAPAQPAAPAPSSQPPGGPPAPRHRAAGSPPAAPPPGPPETPAP